MIISKNNLSLMESSRLGWKRQQSNALLLQDKSHYNDASLMKLMKALCKNIKGCWFRNMSYLCKSRIKSVISCTCFQDLVSRLNLKVSKVWLWHTKKKNTLKGDYAALVKIEWKFCTYYWIYSSAVTEQVETRGPTVIQIQTMIKHFSYFKDRMFIWNSH